MRCELATSLRVGVALRCQLAHLRLLSLQCELRLRDVTLELGFRVLPVSVASRDVVTQRRNLTLQRHFLGFEGVQGGGGVCVGSDVTAGELLDLTLAHLALAALRVQFAFQRTRLLRLQQITKLLNMA